MTDRDAGRRMARTEDYSYTFLALIMASYMKHIWKTTELRKLFDSFSAVLDEMRPIRCIEHKGHARQVTPFVGKQVDICKAFDFRHP